MRASFCLFLHFYIAQVYRFLSPRAVIVRHVIHEFSRRVGEHIPALPCDRHMALRPLPDGKDDRGTGVIFQIRPV